MAGVEPELFERLRALYADEDVPEPGRSGPTPVTSWWPDLIGAEVPKVPVALTVQVETPELFSGCQMMTATDDAGVRASVRIRVGDETLDEALARLRAAYDEVARSEDAAKRIRELYAEFSPQNMMTKSWFVHGMHLITRLRILHYTLPPMVWLLPPGPSGMPSRSDTGVTLYGLPVKIVEGVTPHLAFDLEVP